MASASLQVAMGPGINFARLEKDNLLALLSPRHWNGNGARNGNRTGYMLRTVISCVGHSALTTLTCYEKLLLPGCVTYASVFSANRPCVVSIGAA